MARQHINTGSAANDGTGDTLRIGANKINDNFVEIYTALGGDSSTLTDTLKFSPDGLVFVGNTYNTTLSATEGASNLTITIPATSGQLVVSTATQTLTNKTLTSPVVSSLKINDTSATHTYNVAVNELTANRTITLPLLTGNDTFVFAAHAATLTNKTLTTPVIDRAKVYGHVADSTGAELIKFSSTASAVNEITVQNAASGGVPLVAASGTDTNVNLGLTGQGSGLVEVRSGQRYRSATISSTAQAVNLNIPLTLFNAGGAITATLADGRQVGETHHLINEGTGNVVVTPTSFAHGTSFTMKPNSCITTMWSGDNWHLNTGSILDSSDTNAVVYVTP